MPLPKLTTKQLQETVEAYKSCGMNVSATARLFGIHRTSLRERLDRARDEGLLDSAELHEPNVPLRDDYLAARERKLQAFQRKKRKGDWRKPVMLNLSPEPYRLKIFGDPHLDADGCDYELFERHWLEMSNEKRIYGVCVGDWFNNWLRVLSHLWKDETSRPDDAWLCLEYLMEQRGDSLLAACSGNHDDWTHGPADPVDLLMKKYGVLYRKGAIQIGRAHV